MYKQKHTFYMDVPLHVVLYSTKFPSDDIYKDCAQFCIEIYIFLIPQLYKNLIFRQRKNSLRINAF
jgi:hypothetical protein